MTIKIYKNMHVLQKITGSLVLIMFLSLGQPALLMAATWQRTDVQVNQLHIQGACDDKREVTVYLFTSSSTDPIYNAGARCTNGAFDYADNLGKWNLPKGTYRVVVGEGQGEANFNHIEEVVIANPLEITDNNAIDPIISTLTVPISDTATSTITTVDIDGTSIVTTSNATSTVSTETTNTADSSSTTGTEEQTAAVIVSDTSDASITSPIPDETATSTVPEAQNATSSVSADTNTNGTTTATF